MMYTVIYRELGQMGWNAIKKGTVKASTAEDAKAAFEKWAARPSQYRRVFVKAELKEN